MLTRMEGQIMTRMMLILLLLVVFTTGVAWAAGDVLAYLVENTNARIVCGDYWLDYMPYDRWALGEGSTVLGMDWGPYQLAEKLYNLCTAP